MNEIVIFVIGCMVFGVVLASAFCTLIASDFPNEDTPAEDALKE